MRARWSGSTPISARARSVLLDRSRKGELYYVDDNGRRQDAELHEEILSEGDDARARAVSDRIKEAILSKARGHLPEEPVVPPKEPKKAKDAWNPDQPREPAGTSEGGQFASAGGGGKVGKASE